MTDPLNAPTGCTAPRLGAEVRAALGEELPPRPDLAHHAATCLACALERRAWSHSEEAPASAARSAALLRRVQRSIRGASD